MRKILVLYCNLCPSGARPPPVVVLISEMENFVKSAYLMHIYGMRSRLLNIDDMLVLEHTMTKRQLIFSIRKWPPARAVNCQVDKGITSQNLMVALRGVYAGNIYFRSTWENCKIGKLSIGARNR
jgi:hypothetical protein